LTPTPVTTSRYSSNSARVTLPSAVMTTRRDRESISQWTGTTVNHPEPPDMRRQALRLRLYSIHNGGTSTMPLLRHVAMW
jgi:hypothetical protein